MAVAFLNDELWFPDSADAEPDGLLAVGGDLSVDRLLLAYKNGIFPWYSQRPILWFNPDPRMVLFLDNFKISKSLQKTVNKQIFNVTFNQCFKDVITACQKAHRHKGTWITSEIIEAYIRLHKIGIASSVEVWQENRLVGGIYGLSMNGVFCGESMFHSLPDASKAGMVYLVDKLRQCGYVCIDAQVHSEHMARFGAACISRDRYLKILKTNQHFQSI